MESIERIEGVRLRKKIEPSSKAYIPKQWVEKYGRDIYMEIKGDTIIIKAIKKEQ